MLQLYNKFKRLKYKNFVTYSYYRHFLSLDYNEMRTKLVIAYTHMRLILFIGIYEIKIYQIIAHFRGWVDAYSKEAHI